MHRLLRDFPNTLQLLSLRNCYRGEQAVILCPGGSLDEVDLSLLEGHPHLQGTNGFYARWTAPFRHYFCASFLFYRANQETVTHLPCHRFFLATYLREEGRQQEWLWPDARRTTWLTVDVFRFAPLLINPLRVLPWGPTVLFDLMLPMLLWMGYEEIILLGTDYRANNYQYCAPNSTGSGSPQGGPDSSQGPVQPSGITLSERESEMSLAHQRAEQWKIWLRDNRPGTRIVNCAPGSELPGFERGQLENYVSRPVNSHPTK